MSSLQPSSPLNAQQALGLATTLLDGQKEALRERDVRLWCKAIQIQDPITIKMHTTWFEGYICRTAPEIVNVELMSIDQQEIKVVVTIKFLFEYRDYDTVIDIQRYVFTPDGEDGQWQVTEVEKVALPFPLSTGAEPAVLHLSTLPQMPCWWQQEDYLISMRNARDPLPIQTYMKAIARTAIFREEHPEIECAALVANMLSLNVAHFATQVATREPVHLLERLYSAAQQHITIMPLQNQQNDSWEDKINNPWMGFDELLAEQAQGELLHLKSNCPSMMSFYAALLRLNGFASADVLQVRMHNHDVLLIRAGENIFLFGADRMLTLTPRTLYYLARIYKVFTDSWYWTSFGATNMDDESRKVVHHILQYAPFFQFPARINNHGHIAFPADAAWTIEPKSNPVALHEQVKTQILALSASYPASPLTWAKYAYQSVLVPLPQVYAAWSLQAPILRHALASFARLSDLLATLAQFPLHSIFPEADRLMTADQVLRHRCADPPARALLLFAYLRLLSLAPSACVLLTTHAAYCLAASPTAEGGAALPLFPGWSLWDAGSLSLVSAPRGSLLLAFDDRSAFSPLAQQRETTAAIAPWYHIAKQITTVFDSAPSLHYSHEL